MNPTAMSALRQPSHRIRRRAARLRPTHEEGPQVDFGFALPMAVTPARRRRAKFARQCFIKRVAVPGEMCEWPAWIELSLAARGFGRHRIRTTAASPKCAEICGLSGLAAGTRSRIAPNLHWPAYQLC